MTETAADLLQIITIGATLSGGVIWVCRSMTAPLKDTLDRINKTIDRIEQTLMDEQRSRMRAETWIQEIEDRSKGNAKRVEKIEQRLMSIEKRLDMLDKEIHIIIAQRGG